MSHISSLTKGSLCYQNNFTCNRWMGEHEQQDDMTVQYVCTRSHDCIWVTVWNLKSVHHKQLSQTTQYFLYWFVYYLTCVYIKNHPTCTDPAQKHVKLMRLDHGGSCLCVRMALLTKGPTVTKLFLYRGPVHNNTNTLLLVLVWRKFWSEPLKVYKASTANPRLICKINPNNFLKVYLKL